MFPPDIPDTDLKEGRTSDEDANGSLQASNASAGPHMMSYCHTVVVTQGHPTHQAGYSQLPEHAFAIQDAFQASFNRSNETLALQDSQIISTGTTMSLSYSQSPRPSGLDDHAGNSTLFPLTSEPIDETMEGFPMEASRLDPGFLDPSRSIIPTPPVVDPFASLRQCLQDEDSFLAAGQTTPDLILNDAEDVLSPRRSLRSQQSMGDQSSVDASTSGTSISANGRYVCQICSKSFSRSNALSTHLNTHTGDQPFECPIGCGKRFSVRSNARRHLLSHNIDPKTFPRSPPVKQDDQTGFTAFAMPVLGLPSSGPQLPQPVQYNWMGLGRQNLAGAQPRRLRDSPDISPESLLDNADGNFDHEDAEDDEDFQNN